MSDVPREMVDRALIAWHQPLPSEIPADLEEREAMVAAIRAAMSGPRLAGFDIQDGYMATPVLAANRGEDPQPAFVITAPNGTTLGLTRSQVAELASLVLRDDVQARWHELLTGLEGT